MKRNYEEIGTNYEDFGVMYEEIGTNYEDFGA